MSVQITTRGDGVTEGMKRYAHEKGEKLSRFFNGINKCEIILGTDGPGTRAEILLHLDSAPSIASHAEHEQMNAAIDQMVDRAHKQLLKHKEKLRDHHRAGVDASEPPTEDPDASLESYEEIIEKRDFPS